MIPRTPINNSSNLISRGYDPATQTLHVEFKGGKVGEYANVPPEKAEEFIAACDDPKQSAGSFFATQIRNNYDFKYAEQEEKEQQ